MKANAEAWYAAQQNGWVGDLVELMDVQEPEVEVSVVYTEVIDENSAELLYAFVQRAQQVTA